MLYGVGLAASTNNCQLNVPRIDRPCYQLRENSGYPSIKDPPISILFLSIQFFLCPIDGYPFRMWMQNEIFSSIFL